MFSLIAISDNTVSVRSTKDLFQFMFMLALAVSLIFSTLDFVHYFKKNKNKLKNKRGLVEYTYLEGNGNEGVLGVLMLGIFTYIYRRIFPKKNKK